MPELPLTSVHIDGFRGLKKLELKDMGRINILIGGNNSGKTSVLEALQVLANPYEPQEWLSMVLKRDFGRLDETRVQSLRWCFPQKGQLRPPHHDYEGACEMSCTGVHDVQWLKATYQDIEGYPSDEEMAAISRRVPSKQSTLFETDELWRGARITHYVNRHQGDPKGIDGTPISINFWEKDRMLSGPSRNRDGLANEILTAYSYQINRRQVSKLSEILIADGKEGEENKRLILGMLKLVDKEIVDILVVSLHGIRPNIYLKHSKLGAAPISVFGDAVRRVVLMASTLAELRGGGLLLIDELETGIHTDNLKKVFHWLMHAAWSLDVQIVATTHSLEALDAITSGAESVDELVTYHIGEKDGETYVKRIPGELLRRARRESGLDPR